MRDELFGLELRAVSTGALFGSTSRRWAYHDGARDYLLTVAGTGARTAGVLEAWTPRYHAAHGDLALGQFRADFTRALARGGDQKSKGQAGPLKMGQAGPLNLEEQVNRDLRRFWVEIRFAVIDAERIESLKANLKSLKALLDGEAGEEAGETRDVFIKGIGLPALAVVASVARGDGASIHVREVEEMA